MDQALFHPSVGLFIPWAWIEEVCHPSSSVRSNVLGSWLRTMRKREIPLRQAGVSAVVSALLESRYASPLEKDTLQHLVDSISDLFAKSVGEGRRDPRPGLCSPASSGAS